MVEGTRIMPNGARTSRPSESTPTTIGFVHFNVRARLAQLSQFDSEVSVNFVTYRTAHKAKGGFPDIGHLHR